MEAQFDQGTALLIIKTLKERMAEIIPAKREEVRQIKAEYGNKSLGEVTVDMVSHLFTKGLRWNARN